MNQQSYKLEKIAKSIFALVLLAFIVTALVPLAITGYQQNKELEKISSNYFSMIALKSENLAIELTRKILTQKASDIAERIELISQKNKRIDFQNPRIRDNTVVKFDDSGYTAIYDCKTFKTLAHPNSNVIGTDGRSLKEQYPDWFKIWNSDCKKSEGHYSWPTKNGKIEKKYMVVHPVPDSNLMVAATMPIEAFEKTARSIQEEKVIILDSLKKKLNTTTVNTLFFVSTAILFFLLIILMIGYFCWKLFSEFIYKTINFVTHISNGNFDSKINLSSRLSELDELGTSLVQMRSKIKDYQMDQHKNALMKANYEIASQVSHDIRSPLAALEMISYGLDEISEEKRHIIKDSIARIKGIANTLLEKKRAAHKQSILVNNEEPFIHSGLLPLLESIVIEKNYRYQQDRLVRLNLATDIPSDQLYSKIQKNEFLRVISNLIDNAVESYPTGKGPVELNLSKSLKNEILIQVIDQGKGIPKHLLDQLGQKGFTHGKKNGNGLGLHHAILTLERHHGSLSISSTEGSGTVITCTIPATTPSIKPSSQKPLQFHV